MRRLLIAFAAAVLATLALAAATTKAADGSDWELTLNISPSTILVGDDITLSGVLTHKGDTEGVVSKEIDIFIYEDSQCSDYTDWWWGGDYSKTDHDGAYSFVGATDTGATADPGTYYLQAEANDLAVSGCEKLTVKGEDDNTTEETKTLTPPSEVGVFLCYSKWQVEPGVWPYGTAMALLKGGGYWLPYAVPGNPDYATNLGKYHLVCNLAATQSVSTNVMHSGGEVWSSDDAKVIFGDAVGPLYPVVGGG